MHRVLRILSGVALCLAIAGAVAVVTSAVTGETDKGATAGVISLFIVPVLFFVGVFATAAYQAMNATARVGIRFGRGAVKIGDRALYAVGIDTRKIAARWRERQ